MYRRWLSLLAMVALAMGAMVTLAACGAKEENSPLTLSDTRPSLLFFYTAG